VVAATIDRAPLPPVRVGRPNHGREASVSECGGYGNF